MEDLIQIVVIPTEAVICDICDEDYTNSDISGGFLLLSKGVCPKCEPRLRASVKKYNEEWSIKGECPSGVSFADWIRSIR